MGAGGPAGAGGTSVPLLVAFYSCPELGSAMAGVCVCVPCDIAVLKSNPNGGSGGWSLLRGVGALRTRRVRRRVASEGPADLALCDVCLSEWITCTEGDSPETSYQPWALGRAGRRESERDRARCSLPKWLQ